ncbi:MAG TPA: beta-galactosidase [Dongiaceae bacterium]|nr:beta-galactosidase [Dongiaceae bacterium]
MVSGRKSGLWFGALLIAVAFLLAQTAGAQSVEQGPPTQLAGHNALLMGADWYPEQWPEDRWETDLRMMEEAHLNVARIAEFAWSTMEPEEGRFQFDWLERAIRAAEKHHIAIVLGTPTAGPPAWLTQKYPETLRVDENGKRAVHGNRAHGSVTSFKYRELCHRIAEEMAKRFGHDANVVGWQIDNEYGYALMSYNDEARQQFQQWLKSKYKSLQALNEHWTTSYWSQTYDNWEEIPIPVGENNPGLMLGWQRFVTYAWTSYQQNQIDAIRGHAEARQFITGNFMGYGFDPIDHFVITKPLTFVAWDDYVGSGHLDADTNGISHDAMRGLKRENFWVIETQPGTVNWAPVNNSLSKGETRAMAWHDVGHGADEISYWQWRSALSGQEEIHGTLVAPDGKPVPLLEEVAQTAKEFADLQAAFHDTRVISEVAMLQDYESRWAINWQKHTDKYDQFAILKSWYHGLRKISQSIDIVSPDVSLEQYKLVVAPDLYLIPEERAQRLVEYVKNGGHLVLGPRSGLKDEFNALLTIRQPGFLAEPLGAQVEQYYALEKAMPSSGTLGSGEVSVWAELLKTTAPDAEVLLRFGKSNGWLDGQPAVVTRKAGRGRITYIGGVLSDGLVEGAAQWMTKTSGVAPALGPVPDGIEVSRRVGPNGNVFVLINFGEATKSVALPREMQSLLDQRKTKEVQLSQYGVAILSEGKKL